MLQPTPKGSNDRLPPESLPLVVGAVDEGASYAAYRSHNALFDYRVQHHHDRPFLCDFTYLDHGTIQEYTFGETSRLVSGFAKAHAARLGPRRRGEPSKVVGMLGRSGIDYMLNDLALIRLGHTPLHISPSSAASSVSSLLQSVNACHLLYGPEHHELAKAAATSDITTAQWSSFDQIEATDDDPRWRTELSYDEEAEEILFIIHSSGSTGDPKPIPWRHCTWLACNWFAPTGDHLVITPLCHGYARLGAWAALANASRLYIFPTTVPITGNNMMKSLAATDVSVLWAAPSLLKAIKEADGSDLLKRINYVLTGGSPLPTGLGNDLVAAGVPVVTFVAASEGGSILESTQDKGVWDYVRPRPLTERYFTFEAQDDGTYELVIRQGYPSLSMCNRDNGSWATSDLYTPHTTYPNTWKYHGRKDDIILHVTGMKTNPVPMEHKLKSLTGVRDAMVVGSDRHQAALLVIPNGHLDVGPLLDDLNTNAPKHSQIVSELVKILPEDSTFVLSDKGSIKRAKSIAKYEVEIEALFAAYEGAGGEGGNVTSLKEAETLVDNVLQTVFRRDYATGDDFFDLGMDSLVAIRIRNAIQRRVNFALSSNVVFEHPSAHDLAEHIWHLAQGILGNSVSSSSTQAASDMAFKAKAAVVCREFPKGGPIQSVLLTGATGSLGAHILHQLAGRKIQVYCLCRAGDDDDAARRVDRSLQMRQLPSLEDLQLWSRIDCIKADLADAHLGLSAQAYNTLKSVDAIIHSAWPVNFNLSLASFKPHINGIVNLLNLAPAANFAFISSISAASCGSTEPVPEIIDPDPNTAGSIGYAQSKWVAEQLCGEASIFRIGQISGDSIHGIWNSAEAPAAMIRSAQELGVMPDNDVAGDKVSWLPVDHAAWVVVQLAMSEAAPTVYNLVNYVTTPWSVILEALRETVSFDRVPYKKWLSMLQAASRRGDDAEAIPALKLIEYFAHKDHGVGRRFETEGVRTALVKVMERNGASDEDVQKELTTRFSPITRQAMSKIVSAWRTNGFLQ